MGLTRLLCEEPHPATCEQINGKGKQNVKKRDREQVTECVRRTGDNKLFTQAKQRLSNLLPFPP